MHADCTTEPHAHFTCHVANLHAGMVDTLVCTQRKSHGMTALDRLHALHLTASFPALFR